MKDYQIENLARKAAKLAHPVFIANDWKFYDSLPLQPPTEDRLAGIVESLIRSMERKPSLDFTGTGRFMIYRVDDSYTVTLDLGHSFDEDVIEDHYVKNVLKFDLSYHKEQVKKIEAEIQDRLELLSQH